jgi:hypothetical protein
MTNKKGARKESPKLISKPFLMGAISILVIIFVSMAANALYNLVPKIDFVVYSFSMIASFFIYYAFYELGKRYDNKFLTVISIVIIVASILASLFFISGPMIFSEQITNMQNLSANANQTLYDISINTSLSDEQKNELVKPVVGEIFSNLVPFFIVIGSILFCVFVLTILFGVGLIKLGDKVEYAKLAGILNIVGACTIILFGLGLIVLFVSFIFEVIILFGQAKKFKEIE